MAAMQSLDRDILHIIFCHLSGDDVGSCCLVSTEWKRCALPHIAERERAVAFRQSLSFQPPPWFARKGSSWRGARLRIAEEWVEQGGMAVVAGVFAAPFLVCEETLDDILEAWEAEKGETATNKKPARNKGKGTCDATQKALVLAERCGFRKRM